MDVLFLSGLAVRWIGASDSRRPAERRTGWGTAHLCDIPTNEGSGRILFMMRDFKQPAAEGEEGYQSDVVDGFLLASPRL
jgi:hypothetical protein